MCVCVTEFRILNKIILLNRIRLRCSRDVTCKVLYKNIIIYIFIYIYILILKKKTNTTYVLRGRHRFIIINTATYSTVFFFFTTTDFYYYICAPPFLFSLVFTRCQSTRFFTGGGVKKKSPFFNNIMT